METEDQRRATARENDESMWQRGGGARGHHKASSNGSQKGRSGSPMAGNHLQRQGVGPRYATTKRQRIQREPPRAHSLHFCDSRCHLRNVGRRAVLAVRLHETAPVGPTAQTRRQICDRRPRRRIFCTSASLPECIAAGLSRMSKSLHRNAMQRHDESPLSFDQRSYSYAAVINRWAGLCCVGSPGNEIF